MSNSKRFVDFRKQTTSGSSSGGITSEDHRVMEIEGMFKEAYGTMVTEYTYVDGAVSSIDVWSGVDKVNKLFVKTFTYSGDNVQQIELRDLKTGYKITTTFSYADGSLATKHRQLTQE